MVTVKYDDLSTAFDFVSFCRSNGASGARVAGYGATYWISETNLDREGRVSGRSGNI